jgi:hypothetical protein
MEYVRRLGEVKVTEASVIIAISSPHRKEAIQVTQEYFFPSHWCHYDQIVGFSASGLYDLIQHLQQKKRYRIRSKASCIPFSCEKI